MQKINLQTWRDSEATTHTDPAPWCRSLYTARFPTLELSAKPPTPGTAPLQTCARFRHLYRLHKSRGAVLQFRPIALLQDLIRDERGTGAESDATGLEECRRGLGRNTAGRYDAQHGQRGEDVFDVSRAAEIRRKELHEIRSAFVSQQTFGRCEGTADDRFVEMLGSGDDLGFGHRRDNELRARGDRGIDRPWINDTAHAHEDRVAELLGDSGDDLERIRRGHRHFHRRHATREQRFRGFDELLRGISANDRNETGIEETLNDFGFGHGRERHF